MSLVKLLDEREVEVRKEIAEALKPLENGYYTLLVHGYTVEYEVKDAQIFLIEKGRHKTIVDPTRIKDLKKVVPVQKAEP